MVSESFNDFRVFQYNFCLVFGVFLPSPNEDV